MRPTPKPIIRNSQTSGSSTSAVALPAPIPRSCPVIRTRVSYESRESAAARTTISRRSPPPARAAFFYRPHAPTQYWYRPRRCQGARSWPGGLQAPAAAPISQRHFCSASASTTHARARSGPWLSWRARVRVAIVAPMPARWFQWCRAATVRCSVYQRHARPANQCRSPVRGSGAGEAGRTDRTRAQRHRSENQRDMVSCPHKRRCRRPTPCRGVAGRRDIVATTGHRQSPGHGDGLVAGGRFSRRGASRPGGRTGIAFFAQPNRNTLRAAAARRAQR